LAAGAAIASIVEGAADGAWSDRMRELARGGEGGGEDEAVERGGRELEERVRRMLREKISKWGAKGRGGRGEEEGDDEEEEGEGEGSIMD